MHGLGQEQTLERLFLKWWAASCLMCFQGHQVWWLMLVMPLALKNGGRALSRICSFLSSPIVFLKPRLQNHIWKWEMRPETSMEETARSQSNGGAAAFSKHLHATHVGQYSCWTSVMLIGNRTGESEGPVGPWPTSPILDETTHGKPSKATGAEMWPWFFIWIWFLVFSATITWDFLVKYADQKSFFLINKNTPCWHIEVGNGPKWTIWFSCKSGALLPLQDRRNPWITLLRAFPS